MNINVDNKTGATKVRLTKTEQRQLLTASRIVEALAKNGRCKAAWKVHDKLKPLLEEFGIAMEEESEEDDEDKAFIKACLSKKAEVEPEGDKPF